MAGRIRSIKPEFFLDDEVARLEPLDRLAFIGLWTAADKAGRLEDRPIRLAVQILPYDRGEFEARLRRLAEGRFIVRYKDSSGRGLIQIRTWERHQVPHHTERPSALPEPSEADLLPVTVTEPTGSGETTVPLQVGMVRGMVRGKVMVKPRPCALSGASVEEFERFWAGYPRRTAKGAALSAWVKLSPEDQAAALLAVPRFAAEWEKRPREELQFCPHPSTWLNQRRWEDEVNTDPAAPRKAREEERKRKDLELQAKAREDARRILAGIPILEGVPRA